MSQVATEAILTNSCKQCRQRSALSAVSTMSALLPLWWINNCCYNPYWQTPIIDYPAIRG